MPSCSIKSSSPLLGSLALPENASLLFLLFPAFPLILSCSHKHLFHLVTDTLKLSVLIILYSTQVWHRHPELSERGEAAREEISETTNI